MGQRSHLLASLAGLAALLQPVCSLADPLLLLVAEPAGAAGAEDQAAELQLGRRVELLAVAPEDLAAAVEAFDTGGAQELDVLPVGLFPLDRLEELASARPGLRVLPSLAEDPALGKVLVHRAAELSIRPEDEALFVVAPSLPGDDTEGRWRERLRAIAAPTEAMVLAAIEVHVIPPATEDVGARSLRRLREAVQAQVAARRRALIVTVDAGGVTTLEVRLAGSGGVTEIQCGGGRRIEPSRPMLPGLPKRQVGGAESNSSSRLRPRR